MLARPAERVAGDRFRIALDEGRLLFGRGDRQGPARIHAYEIAADQARVLETARTRGLPVTADTVTIAGTPFRLV